MSGAGLASGALHSASAASLSASTHALLSQSGGNAAAGKATPVPAANGQQAGQTAAEQPDAPNAVMTTYYSDVYQSDSYYAGVQQLSNRSPAVMSGYSDGTFRPYNDATRGAIAKIIVNSMSWGTSINAGAPHFTDVPTTNEFYNYVETAYSHGIMGGYPCGGTNEPCDAYNHPYFRPGATATRGQFIKMFANAMGWGWQTPSDGPDYSDVPTSDTFYGYVESAYRSGAIWFFGDNGCNSNSCRTYGTYNNIKRGDLSQIIYRGQGTGVKSVNTGRQQAAFWGPGVAYRVYYLSAAAITNYSQWYDPNQGWLATPNKLDQSVLIEGYYSYYDDCQIFPNVYTDVKPTGTTDYLVRGFERWGSYIYPSSALSYGGITNIGKNHLAPTLTTTGVAGQGVPYGACYNSGSVVNVDTVLP